MRYRGPRDWAKDRGPGDGPGDWGPWAWDRAAQRTGLGLLGVTVEEAVAGLEELAAAFQNSGRTMEILLEASQRADKAIEDYRRRRARLLQITLLLFYTAVLLAVVAVTT